MSFTITPVGDVVYAPRLSMLLWGEAGCGKTTLACTGPGKKLLILFDPDGDASVRHMPDIGKIDLSTMHATDFVALSKPEPLNITRLWDGYDTVIVDSLTKVSELALAYVIPLTKGAKLENPTIAGWGARNTHVMNFVTNMNRICKLHGKNLILITHEGAGQLGDSGSVVSVPMLLGGQLPNLSSKDFSEVWNMYDDKGKRYIAVRPERLRSPMKSRMFDLSGPTRFAWNYNATTMQGTRLADLWNAFIASNEKLPLPK